MEKVTLPSGANVISVMDVYGQVTLFADADMAENKTKVIDVYMITTGKPISEDIISKRHVGSITVANYGVVHHFFIDYRDGGGCCLRNYETPEAVDTPIASVAVSEPDAE